MEFVNEIKNELVNHMIPFWNSMRDDECGGYYGFLSENIELNKDYPKGCILNSRILWFYSNAYALLKDEKLKDNARHAYEFLRDHFLDEKEGGVYWSVDREGNPVDDSKHTYCQAFAIYGLASYYAITDDDEDVLYLAYELFDVIESKMRDEGGYLEAFNKDFTPASNEKLSENGVMATRTMNTLLHVLEAYTELYRVDQALNVKDRIEEMLGIFTKHMVNYDLGRQEVFFDHDYNTLIDLYSYGHDIETSWLLDRTLDVLNEKEYTDKVRPILHTIGENIFDRAFDGNALYNEAENGKIDHRRIWWVQCESIIGFTNMYQATNDEKYLDAAKSIWKFTKEYIIDKREGGEWHSELTGENVVITTKPIVDEWKCPYHNGRMCIEMIKRLG